jgi:hypothetical protein
MDHAAGILDQNGDETEIGGLSHGLTSFTSGPSCGSVAGSNGHPST